MTNFRKCLDDWNDSSYLLSCGQCCLTYHELSQNLKPCMCWFLPCNKDLYVLSLAVSLYLYWHSTVKLLWECESPSINSELQIARTVVTWVCFYHWTQATPSSFPCTPQPCHLQISTAYRNFSPSFTIADTARFGSCLTQLESTLLLHRNNRNNTFFFLFFPLAFHVKGSSLLHFRMLCQPSAFTKSFTTTRRA